MSVPLCPECHHRPSMRDGDPAYCYCKCHDVADAAPALLVQLKQMADDLALVVAADGTCWPERMAADLQAARALEEAIVGASADGVVGCGSIDDQLYAAWQAGAAAGGRAPLLAACKRAEALHGLVESLAYTLRNALPPEQTDESIAVRQDRLYAIDAVRKADEIWNAIRAAIAQVEGRTP